MGQRDPSARNPHRVENQLKHKLPRCPNGCIPEGHGGEANNECDCFNGFIVDETVAARPVPWLPGTAEKAAVLSARIAYEFELFMEADGQDRSHLGMELLIPTPMERRAM